MRASSSWLAWGPIFSARGCVSGSLWTSMPTRSCKRPLIGKLSPTMVMLNLIGPPIRSGAFQLLHLFRDGENAADREAWEEVLPAEVEARFRDIDFACYDISIPSRPLTPRIFSHFCHSPTPPTSPTLCILILRRLHVFEYFELQALLN